MIFKYRRNSSLSFTISSANISLKPIVYIQFFNLGLTYMLLFRLVFCFVVFLENMCSISNKLNTRFSFVLIFFPIIVRGGFLFTYFIWISWNQIKCNEIYIKLCFMKQSERNISQCILALIWIHMKFILIRNSVYF